jgi:ABC-type polar amino acid transport system ATPase subunit
MLLYCGYGNDIISKNIGKKVEKNMILQVKDISKKYANHLAIDKISFDVKEGEVVSLIGPSGSGKSTLLRSINFLDEIDSGKILFNNIELNKDNIQLYRPKIGMVFQHFNLFPHMSVLENITFAQENILKRSKKEARENGMELLEKVGLKIKADQPPSSLSGGQKQRVAIARSLAMNPDILLLDEPTSALDPEVVKDVLEVIQSFVHTGITIIMATHEMNFAKNAADKIIFLSEGKVIEEAAPEEFFNSPKSKRAAEFLAKVL